MVTVRFWMWVRVSFIFDFDEVPSINAVEGDGWTFSKLSACTPPILNFSVRIRVRFNIRVRFRVRVTVKDGFF